MTRITPKIPPVYGLRIQRERRRKGLSVRELSESSGMATSTVQRAEQGQDATLSTFLAIAGALVIPASVLLADPACGLCDGMPPAGFICSECDPRVNGNATETDREDPT